MKKIFILLILLLLTGCWNYNELNEIAIVTAISIDKNNDGYQIAVLISNASKESSQNITIEGTDKTISEAFQEIELKIPMKLYLKNASVLIIGENLAKSGINEILDYFIRNKETPNKFNIIISKNNDTKKILQIISTFQSQKMSQIIKNTNEIQSSSLEISYIDFFKNYLDEGKGEILPTIEMIDDNVKIGTIAILKNTKLIAYANERQSVGINILNDNINQIKPFVKCDDGKYTVVDITSLNTTKDIDENLNITINVNASGYISESSCQNIIIEKSINKEINDIIIETINFAKKNKVDIFNFGNMYYKKYKDKWNKIKNDWDNIFFDKAKVNININLSIEDTKEGKI